MELRHLRYFVAVAEELNFHRAAKRLHMAQPPLSQRMKDLEQELGLSLFDRARQGVRLTEAGALLLEHAHRVLAEVTATREAMRSIRPEASGSLHVGVPPDTPWKTTRVLVESFGREQPGVLLDVQELTTSEQLELLRNGELDAGLIRHPTDTIGLEVGRSLEAPLGVFLRDDHPLAERQSIRVRDLYSSPLLVFPRSMAPMLYDHVFATLRDQGFLPGAIRHARHPHFIYGLVLAGAGIYLAEDRPDLPEGLVWRPLHSRPLMFRSSTAR